MTAGAAVCVPPMRPEGVIARPLEPGRPIRRIAVLRFHAFGDTVATLPLLGAIATRHPGCAVEVVTAAPSLALFAGRSDVSRVHVVEVRGSTIAKGLSLARAAMALREEPLDALLDLQRSRLSRALALLVSPRAYAAFDRFAPSHGLARYREAAERLGLGPLEPELAPRLRAETSARARELLEEHGCGTETRLVCLNPAGGWPTKQWPLARYAELGRRLNEKRGARVLLLGEGQGVARVRSLAEALGPLAIDLAGKTSADLAMALVARAELMVSDDSALMHLAWAQGVPTVAIFGATRAVWCAPVGPSTAGFYSEDLACGACMQPKCARGDLLCLERVSVEDVLSRALSLSPA